MEKELIDYMLDECDSDFMTFELGINMAGWCEPNDFKKRAGVSGGTVGGNEKAGSADFCFP